MYNYNQLYKVRRSQNGSWINWLRFALSQAAGFYSLAPLGQWKKSVLFGLQIPRFHIWLVIYLPL